MSCLEIEKVERYLKSVLGTDATVLALTDLGDPADKLVKGYGYGTPVRVDYQTSLGRRTAVLHTISPGPFGHEHMADRAHTLLWSHQAFNRLPRHVRSLDVGGFQPDGSLVSLGSVEEFCLLTEYAGGQSYVLDLERIRDTGVLTEVDLARSDALCDYLLEIHRMKSDDSGLYIRRNRELVGDGECIMGLADSYPEHPLFTARVVEEIEHRSVKWRWRLKNFTHRLCQIHGDFHPWNILFESGVDFRLLDRSRGEYGDPADDVTSLTMNYFFFSLQGSERLGRKFRNAVPPLLGTLPGERRRSRNAVQVAAPFFAFRGLVMASPVWYPSLTETVRRRLHAFILAVLEVDAFDPSLVNTYCGA